jgi:hypothetical protein
MTQSFCKAHRGPENDGGASSSLEESVEKEGGGNGALTLEICVKFARYVAWLVVIWFGVSFYHSNCKH